MPNPYTRQAGIHFVDPVIARMICEPRCLAYAHDCSPEGRDVMLYIAREGLLEPPCPAENKIDAEWP